MIYIKKQTNGLNTVKNDTDSLNVIYNNLFTKI